MSKDLFRPKQLVTNCELRNPNSFRVTFSFPKNSNLFHVSRQKNGLLILCHVKGVISKLYLPTGIVQLVRTECQSSSLLRVYLRVPRSSFFQGESFFSKYFILYFFMTQEDMSFGNLSFFFLSFLFLAHTPTKHVKSLKICRMTSLS